MNEIEFKYCLQNVGKNVWNQKKIIGPSLLQAPQIDTFPIYINRFHLRLRPKQTRSAIKFPQKKKRIRQSSFSVRRRGKNGHIHQTRI